MPSTGVYSDVTLSYQRLQHHVCLFTAGHGTRIQFHYTTSNKVLFWLQPIAPGCADATPPKRRKSSEGLCLKLQRSLAGFSSSISPSQPCPSLSAISGRPPACTSSRPMIGYGKHVSGLTDSMLCQETLLCLEPCIACCNRKTHVQQYFFNWAPQLKMRHVKLQDS